MDIKTSDHQEIVVFDIAGDLSRPSGVSLHQAVTETAPDHPIQKFALANGLCLLLKEDHRLPFVQLRAAFRGGVLAETPADNGVTQLTGKLLLKGTHTRSAEQISLQIESEMLRGRRLPCNGRWRRASPIGPGAAAFLFRAGWLHAPMTGP